jgi:hypothetical protein
MISVIVPARPGERPDLSHLTGYDEVIIETCAGGAGHARNVGASKAKGDLLVFIDTDSVVRGDLRSLDMTQHDFWTAGWFSPRANTLYTVVGCHWSNAIPRIFRYPFTIGPFFVVRASAFHEVGGMRLDVLFDDLDLGRRLFNAGYKFGIAHDIRVGVTRKFTMPSHGKHYASSRVQLGLTYKGRH